LLPENASAEATFERILEKLTGRETKLDRLPNRATPAMTKNAPVRRTSAATASLYSSGEKLVDADAAAAATIAADDEVGETIAKRLPPKMA
jgi:hypothetical protein